jgi:hypothetical protein
MNEDGAVILDMKAGTITTLNSTGTFVWRGLQYGDTREATARLLARETGEQIDLVTSNVRQFIAALKNKKLFVS